MGSVGYGYFSMDSISGSEIAGYQQFQIKEIDDSFLEEVKKRSRN